MTIISQLVQKDLINLEGKGETKQELLKNLAETLFEKGYVNDGFAKAILEREEEFPTGLQLEKTAVAIPHTYSEYVKKPFIYVDVHSNGDFRCGSRCSLRCCSWNLRTEEPNRIIG